MWLAFHLQLGSYLLLMTLRTIVKFFFLLDIFGGGESFLSLWGHSILLGIFTVGPKMFEGFFFFK